MSVDIKIKETDISNNNFLRAAELKIGSGSFYPVYPALGSKLPILDSLLPGKREGRVIECYLKITKEKLNEMDNDREVQRNFIQNNFRSAVDGNFLIIPKLLLLEGEVLTDHEIQYLVNLLSFPGNFMYVSPLVYYYGLTEGGNVSVKEPIGVEEYFALTKRFLEVLSRESVREVGLNSQYNVIGTRIPDLLALFKDFSTPITILDGSGRTCIDNYMQIKNLIGSDNSYNLTEKHGEKFMLYSFDSKPTRGKGDVTPAINVLQYNEGFSTFGPRHTVRIRPPPPPPPGEAKPPYIPRIFYNAHYAYSKSNIEKPKEIFVNWLSSKHIDTNENYGTLVKRYRLNHEYENLIESVDKLVLAASEDGLDRLFGSVQEIEKEVDRVKKYNQIIAPSSKESRSP